MSQPKKKHTSVQSVMFSKTHYSLPLAKQEAKKMGFKISNMDKTHAKNYYHFTQSEPNSNDRYVTITPKTHSFVKFVVVVKPKKAKKKS